MPHQDAMDLSPYQRLAKRGHARRATRAVSSQVHFTGGTRYLEQARWIETLSNGIWLATTLPVNINDSFATITGNAGASRTAVGPIPWIMTFMGEKGSSGSTTDCQN